MLLNRVKEFRARFNLTQSDLAEKIGVTRQTVGFIEKGDYSPSIQLALKMAKVFQCSVEEIFWIEEE
ncbi:helix-turn-helix transcriptional regulator [Peribacillus tepidiphilus]|jgi:putative transcriptional regulator|uniref:helix-turn-helix transcriptional regulator n=1 Tax=Peribacillus tepidiphilus TaxID=2652445 RepID=UPI0012909DD5|nr:helix-turn-helix transcriptional regulator [Peribacillus tepidiphilus]